MAYSIEEITKLGSQIYFDKLQEKIEPTENGKFIVIEVESEDYFINSDQLVVLQKAKAKYPNKVFFSTQIGALHKPINNFVSQPYER